MKNVYEKEILKKLVIECNSLTQILIKLNKKPYGSNFNTLKKYLDLYDINYDEILNKSWNKGISMTDKTCKNKLEDLLCENINYSSDLLKKRLINSGYKENKCECCGLSEWNNKPISLELHHINGNHFDNRIENLMILCPNCHSQTKNFRGRTDKLIKEVHRQKIKSISNKKCEYCGKEFHSDKDKTRFCSIECYHKYINEKMIKENYSYENLLTLVNKYNTITDISNELGISRPSTRKILMDNGLYEIVKNKYDFHAKEVCQYDKDMKLIKIWPSETDAENTLNIDISKVLSNKRKSAGGYIWKYNKI